MNKHKIYNLLLATGVILVVLGMNSAAQGQSKDPKKPSKSEVRVIKNRDKEEMHSHTPIKLMGLEEGDNSFRDRTPLLENSDKKPALVDAEKNYERRLAMYDKGKTFKTPVPLAAAGLSGSNFNNVPEGAQGKNKAKEEQSGTTTYWGLGILILSGVALLILSKKGKTPQTKSV